MHLIAKVMRKYEKRATRQGHSFDTYFTALIFIIVIFSDGKAIVGLLRCSRR